MTKNIVGPISRELFVPRPPDLSDPVAADGANPELNRIRTSIATLAPS